MTSAAVIRQQALARAAAGDDAGAARLFDQGLRQFPDDAPFANSAGSFHAGAGRPAKALALFDRALAIMPSLAEAAINRAVVLPRIGRAAEAADDLRMREATLATAPRYWTTRAVAESAADDLAAAAASYDRAVSREPGNVRALHGRARVSLERGSARAVADHERALAASPGDPHLLRGYTHALAGEGRLDHALSVSHAIATRLPDWVEGLELHASLRWAAGDRDRFTDHYVAPARRATGPAPFLSWAAMLSGVDRHAEAADVLAQARHRWPDDPDLALAEAVAAGEAGDLRRADAILATGTADTAEWRIARARQSLRNGDPAGAEALLARAIADTPGDVTAWGLRDLCWRLLGDARHDWLHGQPGLVRAIPLDLSPAELTAVRDTLDALHDRSAMPIGQSVKHGSQTRGALFRNESPVIARAARAVDAAIATYRAGLPPSDPAHPLLRHRDAGWRIAGSWSIRLDGAGHHAAHIHPQGILSSAAYFAVPADIGGADRPGWLELGRPPHELRVDLAPVETIEPREGHCVLFPSTLFHGTRPIAAGRRTTIAFDVALA